MFINYVTVRLSPKRFDAYESHLPAQGAHLLTTFDEFLAANQTYADQFDRGDLPMLPARHVLVLTCMGARLQPEKFLGLELGVTCH